MILPFISGRKASDGGGFQQAGIGGDVFAYTISAQNICRKRRKHHEKTKKYFYPDADLRFVFDGLR